MGLFLRLSFSDRHNIYGFLVIPFLLIMAIAECFSRAISPS
ncbi:MAG: hypothetical protein QNJ70_04150 [Xenococcaceae cyanobacterium MO_207.B15]|nr:hypothetical protein [Xenococcaceae cyanobacterium MO_207.B15]